MDSCDVLIVGGGPAGSSCARRLRRGGMEVALLDKRKFPRDKTCGGWITPAVLDLLEIDPFEYARERVLQPITGFRTSWIGGAEVETRYGATVSYGVRRYEFDEYLLKRSGAWVREGTPFESLERRDGKWIVNGEMEARCVVGAGGHFCPVARFMGADARKEIAVAAQETEFEMTEAERRDCAIEAEIPELYFCADMKGYGWCFRKGNFLNVGLGRMDKHSLPAHVARFLEFLKETGKVKFSLHDALAGHAYLLYKESRPALIADGLLLIGDAAGLAYSQSGEGIRPAIESGLLAAQAMDEAGGKFDRASLEGYRTSLEARFGASRSDWSTAIGRRLPAGWLRAISQRLLESEWFSRRVVLDRWFLHRNEPALSL
jgi:menaquinone-9 beta-reductase